MADLEAVVAQELEILRKASEEAHTQPVYQGVLLQSDEEIREIHRAFQRRLCLYEILLQS